MRFGLAQSLAIFVGIGSACATAHTTGGPEAPVQLLVPEVLAWEPGGRYDLKVAIVNGTQMTMEIAEPKVEAFEVTVYRLDGTVACKTPEAVQKVYLRWADKQLMPAAHWELKRDLHQDCPGLAPGVYRYEASYRANSVEGVPSSLYRGVLGPQGGKVLLREGATSMKYEEIVAAVEHPEATAPAASEPSVTPAGATEQTAAAAPQPSAAEMRACVEKELRDRGMNAYGDPAGTKYADGTPPVEESGRILFVAGRYPDIRRACKIPVL
jgi:hypothetical protein